MRGVEQAAEPLTRSSPGPVPAGQPGALPGGAGPLPSGAPCSFISSSAAGPCRPGDTLAPGATMQPGPVPGVASWSVQGWPQGQEHPGLGVAAVGLVQEQPRGQDC